MSDPAMRLIAKAYLYGYVDSQAAGKPKLYGAAGGLIGYFRKELNIIVTPVWANEVVGRFENGLQS